MWHRFGQGFNKVIVCAVKRAEEAQERDLSTRHLLEALAAEHDLPAARLLAACDATPQVVQKALEHLDFCEKKPDNDLPTLTVEARNAIEAAYCLASELNDQYIGGEHLLLAFLQDPEGSDAGQALAQIGVTWKAAAHALMEQQKWRTCAPEGVSMPDRPLRRVLLQLRGKARVIKRLTYGLSHYQKPFMPYLVFRKRSTDNPYSLYSRLRSQPICWDSLAGQWIVTGYQEVVAALAETHLSQRIYSTSAWSHEGLPPLIEREFRSLQSGLDRQMLFQDAPDQPRQRMLVAKRFTPRVIAQMKTHMQEIADEILDVVQAAGQMDVINDLAVPYPLLVITRMLGLPDTDLALFKKWSQDYFRFLTFETSLTDDLAAYHSVREASSYFLALFPSRRRLAQDDLITLLLQAGDDGGFLPEDEVVANCLLLLATGHENTTRLISSGVLALMRQPEQWRKLCNDPSLVGSAVEEMLRFDSPVQWTLRFLTEDLEWRGHMLKKGQRVQIGIGAANRDPAQFPHADKLDITRTDNRHVAFGHGPHFCLGAALTRLEVQIIFGCLSKRFPSLRLQKTPEWRQEGLAFRGLKSLHVGWDAGCSHNLSEKEN